jgi:hypothetical protein
MLSSPAEVSAAAVYSASSSVALAVAWVALVLSGLSGLRPGASFGSVVLGCFPSLRTGAPPILWAGVARFCLVVIPSSFLSSVVGVE